MLAELGDFRRYDELAVRLIRVALEIFLVIAFGDVKHRRRHNLGHDGIAPEPGAVELRDDVFRERFLFRRVIEDRRTVLGADVVALTVESRGIVNHKEHFQDSPERHHSGVERNLNHFGMAGAAGAYLFVSRIWLVPAHVARFDGGDALQTVEHRFETPEAAAAERCDLLASCCGRRAGLRHVGLLS